MKIEEEDKSLLLLYSLFDSFDPLVMTMLYGKEMLNYKGIVSVLRFNEWRERMTKEVKKSVVGDVHVFLKFYNRIYID